MSNNVIGADNQQATLINLGESSETIRQTPFTRGETLAYVQGLMHDGSLNKQKRIRIVQRSRELLDMVRNLLQTIGIRSWIYREGKTRNLYALETVSKELNFRFDPLRLKTKQEQVMYLRGFFDAEGGIPRNGKRFLIQLAQKDYRKINILKKMLGNLGVASGKIHNPSRRVEPNYWRIFIPVGYHQLFAKIIGSWHPVKSKIFGERMKI